MRVLLIMSLFIFINSSSVTSSFNELELIKNNKVYSNFNMLPNDTIFYISRFLRFKDIGNLRSVSNNLNNVFCQNLITALL